MPRGGRPDKLCIVCNKRKLRRVNGCCDPCDALVQAEGTHEKYGVPKATSLRQKMALKAAEYNKLIAARKSQKEIAELWGIPHRQVSVYAYRWRKAGLKVALAYGNQIGLPDAELKTANQVVRKRGEHGVGWGVTKCKEECCNASRRALRVVANRQYRQRRKQREAAERESGGS